MSYRLLFVLGLLLLIVPGPIAGGSPIAASPDDGGAAETLPGVELAETLATVTGIAITPLLGVSVIGAWEAYKAGPEGEADLPWYASRWFWIPGLVIALLLVFKDPVLGFVPVAKKPLDALDVIENKASALLATPAVVPMVASAFAGARAVQSTLPSTAALSLADAGLASTAGLGGELGRALIVGVAGVVFLAAFFCVWLAFHAINVLILLSPFGPLDFLLRSLKGLVLAVLLGATFVHPYLGAFVALVIVLASIPVAAWSFRLTVFGSVLASDLLTRRHRKEKPEAVGLRGFIARRTGPARARCWGRVAVEDGGLSFSYRPWLIMRQRTVSLPRGRYRLARGLICPLLRLEDEKGGSIAVVRLPPRYRGHDEELVEILALAGVDDLPLTRGLKAILEWMREMAGAGAEPPPRPALEATTDRSP